MGTIQNNSLKTIKVDGIISTKGNPSINANLTLNQSDLALLSPFVEGVLSDISGYSTANINLSGQLSKPNIDGVLYLNNAQTKIDFLNIYAKTSSAIKIKNNKVLLQNLEVLDELNPILM
jgi:autotransporter translocation and assembly factor TamB